MPHGCPNYHRTFAQSTCRNVVRSVQNTAPFFVRHFSSKGKERATAAESNNEEPELILPNYFLPIHETPPTVSNDSFGSFPQKDGLIQQIEEGYADGYQVSQLDAPHSSGKQTKTKRRKRWRLQDIYSQSLSSKVFFDDFDRLYNSRNSQLAPLNTTVVEIILPAYKDPSSKKLPSNLPTYFWPRERGGPVPQPASKPQTCIPVKSDPVTPVSLIPLSYGFGDVEQRADRCRQANQQRTQDIQDVVEGLAGSCREDNSVKKVQDQAPFKSHNHPLPPATFVVQLSLLRIHSVVGRKRSVLAHARHQRTYNSDASDTNSHVRPSLSGSHGNPLVEPVLPIQSSTPSLESAQATGVEAKKSVSDPISRFARDWPSEHWSGDEWKVQLDAKGSRPLGKPCHRRPARKRRPRPIVVPVIADLIGKLRVQLNKPLPITHTMELSTQDLARASRSEIKPSPQPANFKVNSVLDAAHSILKAARPRALTADKFKPKSIKRPRHPKYAPNKSKDAGILKDPQGRLTALEDPTNSPVFKLESQQKLLIQRLALTYELLRSPQESKTLVHTKPTIGALSPTVDENDVLVDVVTPHGQRPIARLAHGLDRALFNHTVHWLQDPHSRVFNFSPHLQSIPPVTDFAFERITPFVSSSNDEDLHALAVAHSKQFAGTTSSLTKLLSQIYMLISNDKDVDISTLSMAFRDQATNFTPGLRAPAMFSMHFRRNHLVKLKTTEHIIDENVSGTVQSTDASQFKVTVESTSSTNPSLDAEPLSGSTEMLKDAPPHQHYIRISDESTTDSRSQGVQEPLQYPQLDQTKVNLGYFDTYAIESGNSDPVAKRETELNVLLWMGTMMEKFLTFSEKDFSSLLRKSSQDPRLGEIKEAYRYAKSSKFVMRSQLDCQDSRLPGTGVFDLKTRAALPIRLDQLNFQQNAGYQIDRMTGLYNSFEREYYDLIRSAFLKYNFQARIGNMDGIFVAYHNTARIFGFQYIPVSEMEARIYGPGNPARGARIFEKCVGLMEVLVEKIVTYFPGESLRCTAETQEGQGRLLLWVSPLNQPEDIAPIVELEVTVMHIVNGDTTDGRSAIEDAHKDWVMNYQVRQSRRDPKDIRETLQEAQSRFKQILPEGTTAEEMEARLESVDWASGVGWDAIADKSRVDSKSDGPGEEKENEKEKGKEGSFKQYKFSKPSKGIRYLRRLAKEGMQKVQQQQGAKQVVWGRDMEESTVPITEVSGSDAGDHSDVHDVNTDEEWGMKGKKC